MTRDLPAQSRQGELLQGSAELIDSAVDGVGGVHYWEPRAVPFGGHVLLICHCGCPGPFVLPGEDLRLHECGVAQAWRDGAARLAICGERDRVAVDGAAV
jgi:hypothetical protein